MTDTSAAARRVLVYVAVPPRAMLLDIAGPLEVLRRANMEQAKIFFDVKYVSPARRVMTSVGLPLSALGHLPAALPDDSIVMIVGNVDQLAPWITEDPSVVNSNQDELALVDWLRRSVKPHHTLVTICSAAIFAGKAGLLDHRACTTHHLNCALLASVAPKAKVLENRLYVQDGNVFTSAGVTSGIDLMLFMLDQLLGRDCTLAIARYLVVYLRRTGSDPQLSPWLEGRNHIHPALHRVQDAIAADPARRWTRAQLAKLAGASGRHLSRLFHDHVGMPIVEYHNRLRVAAARELLSHSQLDMEAVAERAGFESTRQLRRAWSRVYSTSPRHARVLASM